MVLERCFRHSGAGVVDQDLLIYANHGLSADVDFQLFTSSNLTTFKKLSNFTLDYQHFACLIYYSHYYIFKVK